MMVDASDVKSKDNSKYDNVFYKTPSEIGLARHGVPDGYELIAKSDKPVVREARLLSQAKYKLAKACEQYGANVVMDFSDEEFIRNSIGFSFVMHRVKGYPAVMAKEAEDGTQTRGELETRLKSDEIDADIERMQSAKKGGFILKIFGAMMIAVFFAGFILSLTQGN